jgi:hypothetical protein
MEMSQIKTLLLNFGSEVDYNETDCDSTLRGTNY